MKSRITILAFVITTLLITIQAKPSTRIHGGELAEEGQFPYVVSLNNFEGLEFVSYCAGSILSENWIITSAQCVIKYVQWADLKNLYIGVGSNKLDSNIRYVQAVQVVPYSRFDSEHFENDLALIRLETSLEFSDTIKSVSIPDLEPGLSGSVATVIGWGTTETDNHPNLLQYVETSAMGSSGCQDEIPLEIYPIQDYTQICTVKSQEHGICVRDAGGPLVINGTLVGISSLVLGNGECGGDFPHVYTNVAWYEFRIWVAAVTGIGGR